MADSLYYSLWFPNFRFTSLPEKLTQIMRHLPHTMVTAATVYPLDWIIGEEKPADDEIAIS